MVWVGVRPVLSSMLHATTVPPSSQLTYATRVLGWNTIPRLRAQCPALRGE